METVLRASFAYIFLLLIMRVLERRSPSQMTPFQILIILLFGGMMTQAIMGSDNSLTTTLLAILSLGLTHLFFSFLKQRYQQAGKLVDGTPVVVFSNGVWHRGTMKRLRVDARDILAHARKRGLERENQIRYAIVERNGLVSIVEKRERSHRQPEEGV